MSLEGLSLKQKKKQFFSLLLFTLLLSMGLADAAPQEILGSFFYAPGNPIVPPGVTVEAKINGTSYWTTATTMTNRYYLLIPADNPNTTQKEGGVPGDLVEILFNEVPANESVLWNGVWGLDVDLYIHHPPVLSPIGNKTVNESSLLAFTLNATDMDNDTITYSASGLPTGASLNSSSGAFSWTPNYSQSGTYYVTFTASDGDVETTDPNETITIDVNDISGIPKQPAVIYGPFYYSLGNPVVPAGVFVEAKINGTRYGNTTTTENNKYLVSVAADDDVTPVKEGGSAGDIIDFYFNGFLANVTAIWPGSGALLEKTLYIHHAPVLASIGNNKAVDENAPLDFTISATDMDNDAITYSASGIPSGATLNSSTGVFSWTPNYSQAGTYYSIFFASDGDMETIDPNETVTITVNNVNRAPIAYNMTRSVGEDSLIDIPLAGSDADGDSFSFSVVTSPTHGTINMWSCCIARYTPSANYFGTDSFTFRAHDGTNYSNTATVLLTISPVNDAPVLAAIADISVNETKIVIITPNATDVDNTTLIYSINDTKSSWNGTSFNWATTYNDAGVYSFKVTASDGSLSDTKSFRVTVNNVNRGPTTPMPFPANITFDEDTQYTFNITPYFSDPDGDALTYTISGLSNVRFNQTTMKLSALLNWYGGPETMTVTASDGALTTAQSTNVFVASVNDIPVAQNVSVSMLEDSSAPVGLIASDVESAILTYSIITYPAHGNLSGIAPALTYTPNPNYYGQDMFTYRASDGLNNSNTAIVNISIAPVNDAPYIFPPMPQISVLEDMPSTINLTPYENDVDNTRAQLFWSISGGNASLFSATITGNHTLSITPVPNANGENGVTLNLTDASGLSATHNTTITVLPVNDPPVLEPIAGITVKEGETVTIAPNATDAEQSRALAYGINDSRFGYSGMLIGTFTWTPSYDDAGTYDVEVTAYDRDGASDTKVARITVEEAYLEFKKNLTKGWNLISIPVEVANTSVGSVLKSIEGNYSAVFAWAGAGNGTAWQTYYPGRPEFMNTLKNIDSTIGFWIFMKKKDTLNITGKIPYKTNVTLYGDYGGNPEISGWNLIGYALIDKTMPNDTLASVNDKINVVWGNFEPQSYWELYIPYVGGTLGEMKPGYGYWVKMNTTADAVLEYMNGPAKILP